MTSPIPKDPLLAAGRAMVLLLQVVLGAIGIGLVIAVPGFLLSSGHVERAMLEGASANLPQVMTAIVALLAIGLTVVVLAFLFFRQLGRIIATVGEGEPFAAANAGRLTEMGWLALAGQAVAILATPLLAYLASSFPPDTIDVDAGLSLNGIVLVIVLFILARVFRKGAEMREDLEGTV